MKCKFYKSIKYIFEKIKRIKVEDLIDIIKLSLFFPLSLIFRPMMKKKKIWLISENQMEANDNGFALLKYIKKNRKDINVYYVIEKKSKRIDNVKKISNIIIQGSIKHWIYYFNAEVIAVTQKYANPSPAIFYVLHNLKLIKGKRIFLQHGITKDKIKCYYYNVCKFDLFICGAKREYEFVRKNFGYPIKNVVYTGFSRFDGYESEIKENKKIILIAPTWRIWITKKNKNYEYFKKWNEILSNKKLNSFLEEKNIWVKFVLHQEINDYKNNIKTNSKRIEVYRNDEINYKDELMKCKMLITDYSSLAFDIAYLKKKVLYYQFDKDEYRKKHLPEGYFSYEKDGFGKVFEEEERLVDEIILSEENNFLVEEKYLKRENDFFERRDNKNSERIVNEILKLTK